MRVAAPMRTTMLASVLAALAAGWTPTSIVRASPPPEDEAGEGELAPLSERDAGAADAAPITATPPERPDGSATEPQPWDPAPRVAAEAGLALGSFGVGVGLWAAAFYLDVAVCNAVAGDVCGVWGGAIGGLLFVAAQAVLTPVLLGLIAHEAGARSDEGWTFAGAAIGTTVGVLGALGAMWLALFVGEASIEDGLGIGFATAAVLDATTELLVHELTRPNAGPSGSAWTLTPTGIAGRW